MSRIGNNPIQLPPKVEVTLAAGAITVKGPLGTLTRSYGDGLSIEQDGNQLVCKAASPSANAIGTAERPTSSVILVPCQKTQP